MGVLMSRKLKHKLWEINKSKRILKIRTRKNKELKKQNRKKQLHYLSSYKSSNSNIDRYKVQFPQKFSIIYNYEETTNCFNEIAKALHSRKRNIYIYFDMEDVAFITNDAIMYTIALVRNIKTRKGYNYTYEGNTPKNEKARQILEHSGFFKYVNSNRKEIKFDENILMIKTGNDSNGIIAQELCQFTQDKLNKDRSFTYNLYEAFIELMSNTYFHAYNENEESEIFEKAWYVYAEYHENKIKYIFLDIGVGLAATIYKKFSEKFKDFFNKNSKDCDYVESVFTGISPRTQTKLPYRGHGLPLIYSFCQSNVLKNFSVISGHAQCNFNGNEKTRKNHKDALIGTLYYWEITC